MKESNFDMIEDEKLLKEIRKSLELAELFEEKTIKLSFEY